MSSKSHFNYLNYTFARTWLQVLVKEVSIKKNQKKTIKLNIIIAILWNWVECLKPESLISVSVSAAVKGGGRLIKAEVGLWSI